MPKRQFCIIFIFVSWLSVAPNSHALPELRNLYDAPQGLFMGNALTATAQGYAALFYNPANLAKATLREWEVIPVAAELDISAQSARDAIDTRTLNMAPTLNYLQTHPDHFHYFRINAIPAVSQRNLSMAILASHSQMAESDGTTVSVRGGDQLGILLGGATNFAGNIIKVGVSGKAIYRAEINGTFAHTEVSTEADIRARSQQGLALGADVGATITLPFKYLPTLAFVWKDVLNTNFIPLRLLRGLADGKPPRIDQSVNAAFSLQPSFEKGVKMQITAEFKYIEKPQIPIRKRLHFGIQLETMKNFYVWVGANQLLPTAGLGVRVPGGNLEFGTYAEDVGTGDTVWADRRMLLRYTIGF